MQPLPQSNTVTVLTDKYVSSQPNIRLSEMFTPNIPCLLRLHRFNKCFAHQLNSVDRLSAFEHLLSVLVKFGSTIRVFNRELKIDDQFASLGRCFAFHRRVIYGQEKVRKSLQAAMLFSRVALQ